MARHVNTKTNASATPGRTAQAISTARRVAEAGACSDERAGDTMTDCTIATWATAQNATAIQKIASAIRSDMRRIDHERATMKASGKPRTTATGSPHQTTRATI